MLVDKDLVDDCFYAYAYLRWVDDVIDVISKTRDERLSFIRRQRSLVEALYQNDRPDGLELEEEFIAELISDERIQNNGLRKISTWLKMAWLGVSLAVHHFIQHGRWISWRRPEIRVQN